LHGRRHIKTVLKTKISVFKDINNITKLVVCARMPLVTAVLFSKLSVR